MPSIGLVKIVKEVVLTQTLNFLLVLISTFPFGSQVALAAIHLGLSGSHETATLYYEYEETVKTKASVAVDLGSYFRISASGLKSTETTTGYKLIEDSKSAALYEFKAQTNITAMSLDLMTILYANDYIMPFIFAGGIRKLYTMKVYIANGTSGAQSGTTRGCQTTVLVSLLP